MTEEATAFVACYRAVLALAKSLLADANRENVKNKTPRNWPAGQEWGDLVSSSHSIFMRQAREKAGIEHAWFAYQVSKHAGHIDEIYEEAARG